MNPETKEKIVIPFIVASIALTSCGDKSVNKKGVDFNCIGAGITEQMCNELGEDADHDIAYYYDKQEGIYWFFDTTWRGNVVGDYTTQFGFADLAIRQSHEGDLSMEILAVHINPNLSHEQQVAVLKKEVAGHAIAFRYIAQTHPEILDLRLEDSEYLKGIKFLDMLAHLPLTPEDYFIVVPKTEDSVPEECFNWRGEQLTEMHLRCIYNPNYPTDPDIREIVEVYRRNVQ